MDQSIVVSDFEQAIHADSELALPVASVKALTETIKRSKASTMSELSIELQQATKALNDASQNSISVSAGCELFMRFVTRAAMDVADFQAYKDRLIERGELFVARAAKAKQRIGQLGMQFIQDNTVLLMHSYSRVVLSLLLKAAQANKRFTVYVTESRPTGSGYWAARALQKAGIPVSVILDSAIGYIMGKVDLVLVGAEGVVENGGIINQIGTYQMAVVAKSANKPFYVVVESYKFVRQFPLNQDDIQNRTYSNLRFIHADIKGGEQIFGPQPNDVTVVQQSIDYTPPSYITLLFTDLGVLTPSAVSDELIKLYY